jgi:type IV pilus assembly protein PilQ
MALTALRAENEPQPKLVVETTGRPAYTGYHPQPDVYVVDLLKTVKQTGLVLPTNLPDFIASVSVDEVLELGKPVTRVTVRFREPLAAFASASGNGVEIGFEGVTPALAVAEPVFEEPTVAVETIAEVEAPPAPAPAVEPTVLATPAPEPLSARRATRLESVRTSGSGSSLVVEMEGDGRIEFQEFKLTEPLRLVFDIKGTTNKVRGATIDVRDPLVRQIRVAQFKAAPDPVTRVVLDLDEYAGYRVSREGSRLRVHFGDGAPVAVARMQPAVAPPPPAPKASEPVASIAAIQPIPFETPVRRETAVIRGPQTTPETRPLLTESPNVTQPRPAPDLVTAGPEDVFAADRGPEVAGGVRPGESRTISRAGRVFTGDPIDLELTQADIRDVLRTFAELTGLNIAIDPNVSGQVTVSFDDVPWDQALDLILRQNNLTYVLDGNVMRVGTVARLSAEQEQTRDLEEKERLNVPLTTVIKRLSYAKSDAVATLVKGLASPRGNIITDQRTNQLIITDVPNYLPTILNLIESIDIPTPQVMIEARIVETTKDFSRRLGVEWGFNGSLDPSLGTGTGLVFPNRVDVVGGPFNFGAGGNPLLDISLGNVLGTFDLDLVLLAAENEGIARIISSPKVVTQDNEAAEIQSGVQIPFQTRVNFTTTVSFIDATLRLSVTPQITAQDTVIMDIQVQKVEPGATIEGAPGPSMITRRAQTRLMVPDGGTAVIGGIYQSSEVNSESRVPFIHEIPVLGNLFKGRTITNRNDELLIFITPRIIRQI